MAETHSDNLLDQVFAAPINLPSIKSLTNSQSDAEKTPQESETQVKQESEHGSRHESACAADENSKELHTAERFADELTAEPNVGEHGSEGRKSSGAFLEELNAEFNFDEEDRENRRPSEISLEKTTIGINSIVKTPQQDQLIEELRQRNRQNNIDYEADDQANHMVEEKESGEIQKGGVDPESEITTGEGNIDNYEPNEMKDTASEHEHEQHLESQIEQQYESAAEPEIPSEIISATTENQQIDEDQGPKEETEQQHIYEKTDDLPATPTGQEAASFFETAEKDEHGEAEPLHTEEVDEKHEDMRDDEAIQEAKHLQQEHMEGFAEPPLPHADEKRSSVTSGTGEIHTSEAAPVENRSREVSMSSRDGGRAQQQLKKLLYVPQGDDKFQSVRVVKNVRQFVKSWNQMPSSTGQEFIVPKKKQTHSARPPIEKEQKQSVRPSSETMPVATESRRESVANQQPLQQIPEHPPSEKRVEEVMVSDVPVSQRRKNFETIESNTPRQKVLVKEKTTKSPLPKKGVEEISESEAPPAIEVQEPVDDDVASPTSPKSELDKLSPIKERRLFFERKSREVEN